MSEPYLFITEGNESVTVPCSNISMITIKESVRDEEMKWYLHIELKEGRSRSYFWKNETPDKWVVIMEQYQEWLKEFIN
jgi:hypothetical protein